MLDRNYCPLFNRSGYKPSVSSVWYRWQAVGSGGRVNSYSVHSLLSLSRDTRDLTVCNTLPTDQMRQSSIGQWTPLFTLPSLIYYSRLNLLRTLSLLNYDSFFFVGIISQLRWKVLLVSCHSEFPNNNMSLCVCISLDYKVILLYPRWWDDFKHHLALRTNHKGVHYVIFTVLCLYSPFEWKHSFQNTAIRHS